MGIFKRVKDIFNSNVNAALDKMEDPKKMIDLMISELEETLINIKASRAQRVAELKSFTREAEGLNASVARWQERAELAVEAGKDELAREALVAKKQAEAKLDTNKTNIATLESILASLEEQQAEVTEKLTEVKARRTELLSRATAAKEKIKVEKTIEKTDSINFTKKFEALQARIERWEAEAMINSETANAKSTAETFEDMETEKSINEELAALKAKKAPAKKETK